MNETIIKTAYIYSINEKGIGDDLQIVNEMNIPARFRGNFEEFVETQRAEREEMYGSEYRSHLFESETSPVNRTE
jgi:hypothetical protein